MSWKCKACEFVYNSSHDLDTNDERCHNLEDFKVTCPHEHGEMVWTPDVERNRTIDATFDYTFQVFRASDGRTVHPKNDWDFSCPKCHGPAKLESVSAWSEQHVCLECSKDFSVN